MYFKKTSYENEMEILVTQANLVTFTGTVLAAGVTANSEGRKIVLAGTLIDADGNIVKQTGESGSETLTTIPVGILYKTVDVTYGDMSGALIVEGYLRADRVLEGFADAAQTAIKSALPKVTFR